MMAEQHADHHRILHPESSQHYADEPADRQRCQQDDLDSGHHRQRGIRCHVQQVLIIHEVADYRAWIFFDGAAGIRKDAGERSYQVLKYQRDLNSLGST